MGDLIQFPPDPRDVIAAEISGALQAKGFAFGEASSLQVSVEEWRKIARRVGRELKRPIQTVVSADGVHAVLADWPRDRREKAIADRARRAVVEAAALGTDL